MAPRLDPRLRAFARDMRNAATPPEAALWQKLKGSQLGGFKFRRQTTLGPVIVDFFCPAVGLIVELDGITHDAAKDAQRDAALWQKGFEVLRFANQDVGANLDGVLTTILAAALARPPRFGDGLPHPPTPSPEGEGV